MVLKLLRRFDLDFLQPPLVGKAISVSNFKNLVLQYCQGVFSESVTRIQQITLAKAYIGLAYLLNFMLNVFLLNHLSQGLAEIFVVFRFLQDYVVFKVSLHVIFLEKGPVHVLGVSSRPGEQRNVLV